MSWLLVLRILLCPGRKFGPGLGISPNRPVAKIGWRQTPISCPGGQQQIVALAAVLALQPRVLLLDEVTAQLDPHSCKRIQDIISDLRRQGVAVLMVEHNLEQLTQADRIISLRGGRMEVAVTGQGSLSPAMLARVYGDD